MQYNYGLCDKPVCEYCDLVRQATAGAVEPPVAATQKDLKAAQDSLENTMQTTALQLEAQRADGDYALAKNLGARVDAAVSGLVHGVSVDGVANDRKATDTDGTVYIVSATPTGTFAGHANQIASLQSGAWVFQTPGANETHLNEADNQMYTWNGTTWVKVGTVGNSQKLNDEIHAATDKPTPGDNDEFGIADAYETPAYALKKLKFTNLRKAVLDGWGPYFKHLVDIDFRETNAPDAAGVLPTLDHNGETWGITWDNVKAWIFNAGGAASGNFSDDSTIQVRGADGRIWKATWAWIKESIQAWIAGSGKATSMSDTDLIPFISGDATDKHIYRVPISVLKTTVAPVGAPITLWVDDEDVSTSGGEATFTIPAGTNARHIEWDGWAAPQGADSAYPLLVLQKTTANTDVATQAILSSYSTLTHYRNANPGQESTFTGTDGIRMTQTSSQTTHVKGNQNSYFNIKLYRNSNWVQIHWNCFYKSNNDTTILVDGYASGNMGEGEISKFGLYFKDSTNGGTRPVLADAKCVIHR